MTSIIFFCICNCVLAVLIHKKAPDLKWSNCESENLTTQLPPETHFVDLYEAI